MPLSLATPRPGQGIVDLGRRGRCDLPDDHRGAQIDGTDDHEALISWPVLMLYRRRSSDDLESSLLNVSSQLPYTHLRSMNRFRVPLPKPL